MKVKLIADGTASAGGSPLITHHERLADPLDAFVREIREYSKKRSKTDADHETIGHLEFLGGLYTEPAITASNDVNGQRVVVPGWNIIRCLQDGAKRHKRGADVLRGVHPIDQHAILRFPGDDKDIATLWKDGQHYIRKTVGIQRARTMRTRPMFSEWGFELAVELDPTIFDLDQFAVIWRDAGNYVGLCEMRPIYGRFNGTVEAL